MLAEENRAVGIVLKKYARDLRDLVHSYAFEVPQVAVGCILSGVKSALEHLHSLGYVYVSGNGSFE